MIPVLFVTQIVLTILIVIVVLLQKSAGGGLVSYSGSNESIFGAKGAAGFLAKLTMFFGALFLANTIALSYFYARQTQASVVDTLPAQTAPSDAPSAPVVPKAPETKKDSKEKKNAK